MSSDTTDLKMLAVRGVEQARRGEWDRALKVLGEVAERKDKSLELPGIFYSYLGYAVARYRKQLEEGVRLCEHAVKIQYYEAENHLNLARVRLLRGDRKGAVKALDRAVKLDPSQPEVVNLRLELGLRRPPVVGFLSRHHVVNRMLGHVRHAVRGPTLPRKKKR